MKSKFDRVIMDSFLTQTGQIINEQGPLDDPAMGAAPVDDPLAGDPGMAAPMAPPPEPEKDADAEKINMVKLAAKALKYQGDIDPGALSILERDIVTDSDVDAVKNVIISLVEPNDDVDADPINYNKAG